MIEKGYGFANLEHRAPATLDTVYYSFTNQGSKPWDMGKEVAGLVDPAFATDAPVCLPTNLSFHFSRQRRA